MVALGLLRLGGPKCGIELGVHAGGRRLICRIGGGRLWQARLMGLRETRIGLKMRGRVLWLFTKRSTNLDVAKDRLWESWICVTQVGKIVEAALRRVWCGIGLRLPSWVGRRHRLHRLTASIGLRLCGLRLLGLRLGNLRLGMLGLGMLGLGMLGLRMLGLRISLSGWGLKSWLAG